MLAPAVLHVQESHKLLKCAAAPSDSDPSTLFISWLLGFMLACCLGIFAVLDQALSCFKLHEPRFAVVPVVHQLHASQSDSPQHRICIESTTVATASDPSKPSPSSHAILLDPRPQIPLHAIRCAKPPLCHHITFAAIWQYTALSPPPRLPLPEPQSHPFRRFTPRQFLSHLKPPRCSFPFPFIALAPPRSPRGAAVCRGFDVSSSGSAVCGIQRGGFLYALLLHEALVIGSRTPYGQFFAVSDVKVIRVGISITLVAQRCIRTRATTPSYEPPHGTRQKLLITPL
ncbi:hypothetical protein B0H17DRAFT_1216789 [Mycena rosella]|uniref:Uncharacterized protein n=1 Tax=Mycena rosella TaxID=1033263 RepID=A0AAD7FVT6_MYCRO|nr:hypothetical protein B0H17DRAFT_1216789 [Mycena rosella]